ncbi:MAG TPA: hypothetical protein VMX13_14110 [Sedimentisphaerales bacterium]|nr:hypothetical protein [Sedimentisphaerales bacterium]
MTGITPKQLRELSLLPRKQRLAKLDELLAAIPEPKDTAVTVKITGSDKRRLDAACARSGLTQSDLITQAIQCYMIPEFWAFVESGGKPGDFSGADDFDGLTLPENNPLIPTDEQTELPSGGKGTKQRKKE